LPPTLAQIADCSPELSNQDGRALWAELHQVYARKSLAWPGLVLEDGASHTTLRALSIVEGHVRRVVGIKASPPLYRGIVADLGGALITSWGVSESLVLEAADDIAATADRHGRGRVGSSRAAKRIDKLQADLAAAGKSVTKGPVADTWTRYLGASYLLGQTETTSAIGWQAGFSLVDEDTIAALSGSGLYWIGNHYGEALDRDRLLSEVEGMLRDGMGRVDGGKRLRAAFGREFHRSDAYWRGMASTAATRARSFGALSGMEATGATVYEYVNPVDERSSAVCLGLDGTRFTVKGGVELRENLLQATTPGDWKEIAPWPKVKDLDGPDGAMLSPAELQAKGIAWPPLHFHCRSSIDVVSWSTLDPGDLGPVSELHAGPKPPSKPRKPRKPKAPPRHDVILGERTAGPAGSNAGGFYTGTDGVKRYVKFYDEPGQAASEHLANRLYRDLGLGAPRSELFKTADGKLAYASEILENVGTLGDFARVNPGLAGVRSLEALDGFAADVLTANWDAAGLDLDNIMVLADGSIARIDNGAAFLTRAQGLRKPLDTFTEPNPVEWARFWDGSNAGYSKLAKAAGVERGHDLESLGEQIDAIVALRPKRGGWAKYVGEIEGMTDEERRQVAELLEVRTAFLKRKRDDWRAIREIDALESANPWDVATPYGSDKYNANLWADRNLKPARVGAGRLPAPAYDAAKDYTGSGYRRINSNLRSGGAQTAADRSLTKAIKGSKLPEDVVLYRGANSRTLTPLVNEGILSEGGTDTDLGFGSTAFHRSVSDNWASSGSNSMVFRILARKGSPAMWVDDISANRGEMELLLPPGSTIRVLSSKWNQVAGRWEVDAILE